MIVLERITVAAAAERWKAQYCRNGEWGSTITGPAEETYARILEAKTPDEVEGGSLALNGWTTHWCQSCKAYQPVAIEFEERDYESGAIICLACIEAAAQLIAGRISQ